MCSVEGSIHKVWTNYIFVLTKLGIYQVVLHGSTNILSIQDYIAHFNFHNKQGDIQNDYATPYDWTCAGNQYKVLKKWIFRGVHLGFFALEYEMCTTFIDKGIQYVSYVFTFQKKRNTRTCCLKEDNKKT
jgi:hypothetical protein